MAVRVPLVPEPSQLLPKLSILADQNPHTDKPYGDDDDNSQNEGYGTYRGFLIVDVTLRESGVHIFCRCIL